MFNTKLDNFNFIDNEEIDSLLEELKINYSSFWRGIVVDNNDPDKLGRVKVRIPQIYGIDIDDASYVSNPSIPWATCAISQASNDSGTFLPPNIGDTVFVTFENGQPDCPLYFGGIYTLRRDDEVDNKAIGSYKVFNNRLINVVNDDLPKEIVNGTERIIYKSVKGALIMVDDKDGEECIKITDQSGQSIIMENLSKETLNRRGNDIGKNPKSQIVLTNSSGDSITLSQGKIHLKSENIIIETDNFKQVNSSYNEEIELADIILGSD